MIETRFGLLIIRGKFMAHPFVRHHISILARAGPGLTAMRKLV